MKVILAVFLSLFLLSACGGGGGSSGGMSAGGNDTNNPGPTPEPEPEPEPEPQPLDAALLEEMKAHVLTGDPASPRKLQRIKPSEDSLVKLGQVLFFSQTLSGGFDVACATCHLPQFGGSDGLSLSVGGGS